MASPAVAAASRFCIQVTCCIQMGRSDCVQDTNTYYVVYLVKKVVSTSKQSVRCTWAKQEAFHEDHSSITSAKRWVGGVRKWEFLLIYSTIYADEGGGWA